MKRHWAAVAFLLCLQIPSYLIAQTRPSISISDSSLTLDNTEIGASSQKTFTISNTSSVLIVTRITMGGTDSSLFKVSPTSSTIAAGQRQTVTVIFAPNSEGAKIATASVFYSGSEIPLNIALRGTGIQAPIIKTLAGKGSAITGGFFSGDGDLATRAELKSPSAVATDLQGNVYIADTGNNRIRLVTRVGSDVIIATFWGGGALLDRPSSVSVDAQGNVYIADTGNHRIIKIDSDGNAILFAGTSRVYGSSGDEGPANRATLNSPSAVAIDDARGAVYIADTNNGRIRQVDRNGIITTLIRGLDSPTGVAVDTTKGDLYIAETRRHLIHSLNLLSGTLTKIAGGGEGEDGGLAVEAGLSFPRGIAVDKKGNLYIADTGHHYIRRVSADGVIRAFAGVKYGGTRLGDGGLATQAGLYQPSGVAVDSKGNVYIADTGNHRIRYVETVSPAEASIPSFKLSASSLTFDSTKVGSMSQKTLAISNTGIRYRTLFTGAPTSR